MSSFIYGEIILERSRNNADERTLTRQMDDLEAGARALNLEAASPWPEQYPPGIIRTVNEEGRHMLRFCYGGTEAQIEDARTQLTAYLERSRWTDGMFGTSQID